MPMTLAGFLGAGVFLKLASGFGLFFGLYGFLMVLASQLRAEDAGPWQERSPLSARLFAMMELVFQFWFNFLGGFVGWIAVAFLWNEPFPEYGWKDLVAIIIAFLGVTGNLPYFSTGIRAALVGLGKRLGGG